MLLSELLSREEAPTGKEKVSFFLGVQHRGVTILHDVECQETYSSNLVEAEVPLENFGVPALFKRTQVCWYCCGNWIPLLHQILQKYGVILDHATVHPVDVIMNLEAANPLGAANWVNWLYQQTVNQTRAWACDMNSDWMDAEWHGPWVVSFDTGLPGVDTWFHGVGHHVSVRRAAQGRSLYVHSVIPEHLCSWGKNSSPATDRLRVDADFTEAQLRLAVDFYEEALKTRSWSPRRPFEHDARLTWAAEAVETARLCLV